MNLSQIIDDFNGTWQRLSALPGGRALFSKLLNTAVPYTGSIKAQIVELAPGKSVVTMRDRRRVRNHLNSIHAVALMNLGELCTGTATMASLTTEQRAILVGLGIRYHKKARGTLTARCETSIPVVEERQEVKVSAQIFDSSETVVAEVDATWLVGPKKPA